MGKEAHIRLYFTVQAASFDIFSLCFLLLAAAVYITAAVYDGTYIL